jgi:hypothetical protein
MAAGAPGAEPLITAVERMADLPLALDRQGLTAAGPVLVVVGGAAGLEPTDDLAEAFTRGVVPAVVASGAIVLDGGTDAGVMALVGAAREATSAGFPLIGVAARGTVSLGTGDGRANAAPPARGHSHLVLVPGDEWGDESEWLSAAAAVVAGGRPTVTLLANGGPISRVDVRLGLAEGRPLVVLAGTGRLADELAAASTSTMVRVVAVAESAALREVLTALLTGRTT